MNAQREIHIEIVRIVAERQRHAGPGRGVLPRTVQGFLDIYRAEYSLRRDMMHLVGLGLLVRVGGVGARRGYRVPGGRER